MPDAALCEGVTVSVWLGMSSVMQSGIEVLACDCALSLSHHTSMYNTLPTLQIQVKGSDGSGYDGEDTGDGDTEDGTDNGGSSRRRQPTNKRARLGGATSSNPDAGAGPSQGVGGGGAKTLSDPGSAAGGAAAAAAAAGVGGGAGAAAYQLELMQAYQAQAYWDPAQNEVGVEACFLRCAALGVDQPARSIGCQLCAIVN